MVPGWELEEGRYGTRLVLKGPWSAAVRRAAERAQIKEVELNYAKGWTGGDISFLKDLPGLEAVDITDWARDDVSVVNDLPDLRHLGLSTYCKTELDFSNWPNLEECQLEWRPKAASLFEHRGLKRLFIGRYPSRDIKSLAKMESLLSLRLASPSRLEVLEGIDSLPGLKLLGLYRALRLKSLEGIPFLTELDHLEIYSCRKFSSIGPVGHLPQLRELHLCDDGDIPTIAPLRSLVNLKVFLFTGSTNVIDGDLSPLFDLPRLRKVAFKERRHYSHRRVDLSFS